ncbi:hypothetical protein ACOMHN_060080 [Nucella lapillus]
MRRCRGRKEPIAGRVYGRGRETGYVIKPRLPLVQRPAVRAGAAFGPQQIMCTAHAVAAQQLPQAGVSALPPPSSPLPFMQTTPSTARRPSLWAVTVSALPSPLSLSASPWINFLLTPPPPLCPPSTSQHSSVHAQPTTKPLRLKYFG